MTMLQAPRTDITIQSPETQGGHFGPDFDVIVRGEPRHASPNGFAGLQERIATQGPRTRFFGRVINAASDFIDDTTHHANDFGGTFADRTGSLFRLTLPEDLERTLADVAAANAALDVGLDIEPVTPDSGEETDQNSEQEVKKDFRSDTIPNRIQRLLTNATVLLEKIEGMNMHSRDVTGPVALADMAERNVTTEGEVGGSLDLVAFESLRQETINTLEVLHGLNGQYNIERNLKIRLEKHAVYCDEQTRKHTEVYSELHPVYRDKNRILAGVNLLQEAYDRERTATETSDQVTGNEIVPVAEQQDATEPNWRYELTEENTPGLMSKEDKDALYEEVSTLRRELADLDDKIASFGGEADNTRLALAPVNARIIEIGNLLNNDLHPRLANITEAFYQAYGDYIDRIRLKVKILKASEYAARVTMTGNLALVSEPGQELDGATNTAEEEINPWDYTVYLTTPLDPRDSL